WWRRCCHGLGNETWRDGDDGIRGIEVARGIERDAGRGRGSATLPRSCAEPSNTMRILLARHGETPWNAEGRYQGHEDIALSPVGESQARALGERLREVRIDRAVASPLSRARRTAELALGESRAAMLTLDPGLMEIAHGTW